MSNNRVNWNNKDHEAGVERFYGNTVEGFGDFHGGYLNFGLWEKDINNYLNAAENLVKTLGGMLNLSKKSRLLDVGCGMGSQDVFLYKNFTCNISAIDVTWNHVKIARERIKKEGLTKEIQIYHGTATNLNFQENKFTNLISIEAPEHFDTREKFFYEAYRVLKPKGIMCLSDYVIKRKPKNIFEKFIIKAAIKLWHVPNENVYDSEVYKEKLAKAGFKNIEIRYVGKFTIPGYYYEQRRKEVRKALAKIRGLVINELGFIIDYLLLRAFKLDLIEYILVKAKK